MKKWSCLKGFNFRDPIKKNFLGSIFTFLTEPSFLLLMNLVRDNKSGEEIDLNEREMSSMLEKSVEMNIFPRIFFSENLSKWKRDELNVAQKFFIVGKSLKMKQRWAEYFSEIFQSWKISFSEILLKWNTVSRPCHRRAGWDSCWRKQKPTWFLKWKWSDEQAKPHLIFGKKHNWEWKWWSDEQLLKAVFASDFWRKNWKWK